MAKSQSPANRREQQPGFVSAEERLQAWFDVPRADMPAELRDLADAVAWPVPWDSLDASRRRLVAQQYDGQHDPRHDHIAGKCFAIGFDEVQWNELLRAPNALQRYFLAQCEHVRKGRHLLERLCAERPRNDQLSAAWRRLARHLNTPAACRRLWGEIVDAYACARRRPALAERKKAVTDIAAAAEALRVLVEGDDDFERLVYEFFPAEVLAASGVTQRDRGDALRLNAVMQQVIEVWPSLADVLAEVRDRARSLQDKRAMHAHLGARRRSRMTDGSMPWNFFAVRLDAYFRHEYGKPLTPVVEAFTRALYKIDARWSAKKAIENAARKNTITRPR